MTTPKPKARKSARLLRRSSTSRDGTRRNNQSSSQILSQPPSLRVSRPIGISRSAVSKHVATPCPSISRISGGTQIPIAQAEPL